MKHVKVRVPASTTNLGPGFDSLGMALNLYSFPIQYRALLVILELLKEADHLIKRDMSPGLSHE